MCLVEHAEIARAVIARGLPGRRAARRRPLLRPARPSCCDRARARERDRLVGAVPSRLDQALARGEPGAHLAGGEPGSRPALRPRSVSRRQSRSEGHSRRDAGEHHRPARELDDRRRAERRLGDAGLRRAGRRASVGSGRSRHRLDEPDPVAAWRTHAETLQARADALNARVRRDPLSRPGNRSHGGPHPGSELALRDIRDREGHRAHPEHADGRGLHDARLAACGGRRALDAAARRRRDEGVRSRGPSRRRQDRRCDSHRRSRDRSRATRGRRAGAFLGEVALVDGSSPVKQTGSCSATRSSTRTPPATSRTAPASPGVLPETLPPDELLARASTSRASTRTSWSAGSTSTSTGSTPTETPMPIMRQDVWQLH